MMRLGKDTSYKIWEIEGVGNKKKLVVITNIDHPFYMVIQDGFMLWVKHNIVEAVAEFFTQETGTTESMLLIKSDILKHIGKMNIEMIDDTGDEGAELEQRPRGGICSGGPCQNGLEGGERND